MCNSPAVSTTMPSERSMSLPGERSMSLPAPAPTTLSLPPKAQNALAMYNPMSLIEKEDGPKPQKYSEVDIDGLIHALKNPPEQIVDLYIHYCPRIKSDTDNCSVSLTLADHSFVRRLLYRFDGPDRTNDSDHKVCTKVINALVASPAVTSVTLEIDYVQSDVIVAELCTALHTNRTLKKLSVYSDNRFQQPLNAECVKHIAEMFLVNTGIRELQLGLIDVSLQVADNLALALRRNRSLQGLTLYARIDSEAVAILTKPFSGQEPNQTLQKLEIKGFKCLGARGDGQIGNKGAEHIATILCRNSFLKELALKNCMIDSLGVQTLALALMTNKSLEVLDLSYNPLDVDGLKEIVKTITMDPATQVQPNTTFREIIIRHSFISRAGASLLANMLKTNKTLVRLDLQFSVRLWTPKDVLMILHSLKNNQSLRFLDLRGCEGVDGAKIRDTILDLLVTNPWLEQVGVEGTPLSRKGHDAVIKAQLRRNVEKFSEVFKGMGTVTPNAARVFLCGIPFAGKTTFRKTMVYSNIKRTSSSVRVKTSVALENSKLFSRKESQTTGIEVQVIVEDDVHISIWDLAGHEEFHAFHDLVVPNLSSQGSACSFVLLCDISVPQGKGGSKFALKDVNVIDQELRYWLRFIASNTRQSLHMLPNVTVIFTHSDKFPKVDLITHCKQPVEKLRVQFLRVINVTEFHVCDARSRKSIEPVQKAMQKRLVSLLDRVPKVFDACSQLQIKLNEWKKQHPDKPLIKWSDFTLLCSKVPALKRLQGQDANIADERARAVARAMHDAGELLYFDGLDFMVVDPNWFCHEIMGRILSLDSSLVVLKQPLIDQKGYTKREHLKKVLEASFCKNKNPLFKGRKVRGVIPEDLVQLMVKLNLCFEVNPGDQTSGIVIPASLSNRSEECTRGERPLSWPSGHSQVAGEDLLHIGWRLKCEDPDVTFLTLGFFPRLQVFLQKKFSRVSGACYTIEKDLISFVFSGLEFLIEYKGPEDCQVDILVRSSKDSVETWATVEDTVLKPTREFCASPTEGCQGVVLIEEIMRPQCVRELWVRKKRTKDQCIGVEYLKQKVLASARLDYEYIWKKSMEESHGLKADRAEDLLGPENWEDVLNRYLDNLEKIDFEVNSSKSSSSYDMNSPLSPLTPQPSRRIGRTVSLLPRPSEMTRQLLESRLMDRSMEVEVYQKRLFLELSRNIDQVVDFPFLLQDGKVPHLVYLSTGGDAVNSERLVTRLTPGSYSRKFHLMCEHRDGIHMIDHQVGGIMRCDAKSVRSVRPHMLWGLKLVSTLLRISELAAGGFSNMLTEAERMRLMGMVADDDAANDSIEWPDVTGRLSFTPEEMMAAEDWLIQYLNGKNIASLFGLYKVAYLEEGTPSKHTAWICDKHVKYGLHHGTVQTLPM